MTLSREINYAVQSFTIRARKNITARLKIFVCYYDSRAAVLVSARTRLILSPRRLTLRPHVAKFTSPVGKLTHTPHLERAPSQL